MTTTLSINLPDNLAKESLDVAGRLGISRTQFIRQAIAHEIKNFQSQLEQEAIVKSITAMKADDDYLKEAEKIIEEFPADLPDDGEEWWTKKKS